MEKSNPNRVLSFKKYLWRHIGEHFGWFGKHLVDSWKGFAAFLGKCLGDRSGTAFGSILDSFCTDFMNMIGVMLDVIFLRKMVLPHASSFFKVSIYSFV